MDRRKRKTREAIRQACLELINEKGFEAMTILDITERADINRGTFYLHYVDKYAMLDSYEEEIIDRMRDIIESNLPDAPTFDNFISTRYPTLVQLFECFRDERDILDILFKTKGIISIQQRLTELFGYVFTEIVQPLSPDLNKHVPRELFLPIIVSICLGFAQYWMDSNEEYTPEFFAKGVLGIILNGPAKAMGLLSGDVIDIEKLIEKT